MRVSEFALEPSVPVWCLSEDILREQRLIEGFLDTAKAYLGDKFKDTIEDIKGDITDLKQAGILLKDAFSCAPVFNTMSTMVGKSLNSEFTSFAKIAQMQVPAPVQAVFAGFVNFIGKIRERIYALSGAAQFFAKLGFYGIIKYINEFLNRPDLIKNEIINTLQDKATELLSTVTGQLSLPGFMSFFGALKSVKNYFLDVLTAAKRKMEALGPRFSPRKQCANLQTEVREIAERALTQSTKYTLMETRRINYT